MFTVDDPLRKLHEKLTEKTTKIEGLQSLRKLITPQDTLDRVWQSMPRASLDNILSIMGVNNQTPFTIINSIIAQFQRNLLRELSFDIEGLITNWELDSEDWSYNDAVRDLDQLIERKRRDVQTWVDENMNSVADEMTAILQDLDLGQYVDNVQDFLSQLDVLISAATDIMQSLDSCFNLPTDENDITDTFTAPDNIMNKAKQYSSAEVDPISILAPPRFGVPYLPLSDYMFLLKDTISVNFIRELQTNFDIYKLFPKLKFYMDQMMSSLNKHYTNFMKYNFWDVGFDPRPLINFPIPRDFVSNFSLLKFDFPELICVFFLAQSGALPYPYLLTINNTNESVPGVIDARTMEFLITIDIADPIKVIKKNFGSYTVPLKTQIETILNQSLGLYYDPVRNVALNLCDLPNFAFPYEDVINDLQLILTPKFLKNFPGKSLYSSLDYPNPDLTCKLMRDKMNKDRMDIIMGSFRLNNSSLPPKLSKLSGLTRYGLTDFDGDLVVDELKRTFDVSQFPKIGDVLGYPQQRNTQLLFSELGTASKNNIDILPELSVKAPYIQDDLPAWERLHLGNVPFLFFLAEFLFAAKRGAKLPIPEVNPALEL